MRRIAATALLATSLLCTSLAVADDLSFLPSRAELLSPAPNPAWDRFSTDPDAVGTYPIADGVYLFVFHGTNALFMVTEGGVIATDPIRPHAAPRYLHAIREITDKPIKYLVYSHWHWDHVEGGQVFKDAGATILAHEKCVPHFREIPNPNVVMPDETFPGTHTVQLGGRSLKLLYLGTNHSDCLVLMQPDGVNALFVVDLLTPGSTGAFMDSTPLHWVKALKQIEAMDLDYIISGHGVPIAHPSAVTERRRYIEALISVVGKARDDGLQGADRRAFIDRELAPYAYMRNFDSTIDTHIRRIQTFHGTGW